jgi:Rubisco LSMT substrate-binding
LHWARNEAGIEASKVCVKGEEMAEKKGEDVCALESDSRQHVDDDDYETRRRQHDDSHQHPHQRRRGLYATDIIYPGERILFVPARALLGDHMLREMSQRSALLLQDMHQQQNRSESSWKDHEKVSREFLEQMAMAMIEEIRQSLLVDPLEMNSSTAADSSSFATLAAVIRQAAINVGYQWRPDDGVAMYLAVARFIINESYVSGTKYDSATSAFEEASHLQEHAAVAAPTGILDASSEQPPLLLLAPAIRLQSDEGSTKETVVSPPSQQHPDNSIVHEQQVEHVLEAVAVVAAASADEKLLNDEASSIHQQLISFLPHVQILPDSFETSPLYYTANELARIEGTNCHTYSVRMREQIQRDWMQLHHVLQAYSQHYRQQGQADHDDETLVVSSSRQRLAAHLDLSTIVTLEAYKWALCNVYSRSSDFQITTSTAAATTITAAAAVSSTTTTENGLLESSSASSSVTSTAMMRVIAPLFDMMNHDFHSDLSHAMDQDGNISVFNGSHKAIQPGQEICLCYGNFGNEKLLFIYGFTVPENPFDVVSIYAPIRPSDPLYHVKARILQTKCGISDTTAISHSLCMAQLRLGKSILPESLLAVLRVVGIQTADEIIALAQPSEDDDDDDNDSAPASHQLAMISESNERGALIALHHALDSMSRRMALNLISDEGLQASSLYPLPLESVVEEETSDREANHISTGTAQALSSAEAALQVAEANVQNAKNLCQSELTILIAAMSEITERLAALDGLCGDQQ